MAKASSFGLMGVLIVGQWQGHPPRQSTDLEDKGVDDKNGIFAS